MPPGGGRPASPRYPHLTAAQGGCNGLQVQTHYHLFQTNAGKLLRRADNQLIRSPFPVRDDAMQLNKILIVIDPTTDQQPAFERGLDSARDTGALLHLYACVNEQSGYASIEEAQQKFQPILDDLASRVQSEGFESTSELEWAPDWAMRAVSAATRCAATMIFKNSFDHSPVQRELRPTSDWTLLRMASCPVLMVKNFQDWQHRRVLAAINPASTEAAHIKLNQQIISLAQQLAGSYGSDAHFVTAFQDLNHAPDSHKIAQDCAVPPEQVHLKKGKAAEVIREVAAQLDVDLIIVGTVKRDGIKGRVVGNTCERLLDQTQSDLLVLN
jgi:universal stress protein E